MSSADVLPNESASTSHFSTVHSRPLAAHSHDESFPIVTSVVDQYMDCDISSANSRTLTWDKSLIEPGVESRGSRGSDTKLADIAKSHEALDTRARYCAGMTVEMERNGPFCNLANHFIRQFSESNSPPSRNDPKITKGVYKSRRKPDGGDIWDGHAIIGNRMYKNYGERDPSIHDGAGQNGEGSREGSDGKWKHGGEKKGVNRFVHQEGKVVQCVADKEKCRKILSGDFDPLASPTLNLKGLVGSGNLEVYFAGDVDDLMKESAFRSGTTLFDEMSKPVNRICRAIIIERPAPLKYVKYVDHFKQAIRDVVLAHHLVFFSELHIPRCDISVDSLIIRYSDANTLYGILIDFDLGMMFGEITRDHMGTRTRSRPFMAWELLESDPPPIHLERFDWESFFYVICWIGCRYSEGNEVNKSALSIWYSPDDETLISIKRDWLSGPGPPQRFTPFYDTLIQVWIKPLQAVFYDGRKARWNAILNKEFDEVTLGGHVTWDRFWGILQN